MGSTNRSIQFESIESEGNVAHLLTKDQNIKDKQDLEKLGLTTDWWSMLKLESRYKKDKNMGFFEGKVQMDELWIYTKEKIIKKLYISIRAGVPNPGGWGMLMCMSVVGGCGILACMHMCTPHSPTSGPAHPHMCMSMTCPSAHAHVNDPHPPTNVPHPPMSTGVPLPPPTGLWFQKRLGTTILEYDLEDESVKEVIKWVQNSGYNIDIDDWMRMWKENYNLIKLINLRENILKMFYRWHLM